MFGSFPPSPLVGLRLQSLPGPGSRHCYGIITLIDTVASQSQPGWSAEIEIVSETDERHFEGFKLSGRVPQPPEREWSLHFCPHPIPCPKTGNIDATLLAARRACRKN
jgi:hypothetical protein